jgi:hypothetical protein
MQACTKHDTNCLRKEYGLNSMQIPRLIKGDSHWLAGDGVAAGAEASVLASGEGRQRHDEGESTTWSQVQFYAASNEQRRQVLISGHRTADPQPALIVHLPECSLLMVGHEAVSEPRRIAEKHINPIAGACKPNRASEIPHVIAPDVISFVVVQLAHDRERALKHEPILPDDLESLHGSRKGRDCGPTPTVGGQVGQLGNQPVETLHICDDAVRKAELTGWRPRRELGVCDECLRIERGWHVKAVIGPECLFLTPPK